MKLILTREVTGLGAAGDIVEVADGYGRNYLVPRGAAITWSKGAEKQVSQIKRARDAREIRGLDHAKEIKVELEKLSVLLPARAGEGGKLFGSITAADVVGAVKAAGGPLLDKKRVQLPGHIKTHRIAHGDRRAAPGRRCLGAGGGHRQLAAQQSRGGRLGRAHLASTPPSGTRHVRRRHRRPAGRIHSIETRRMLPSDLCRTSRQAASDVWPCRGQQDAPDDYFSSTCRGYAATPVFTGVKPFRTPESTGGPTVCAQARGVSAQRRPQVCAQVGLRSAAAAAIASGRPREHG